MAPTRIENRMETGPVSLTEVEPTKHLILWVRRPDESPGFKSGMFTCHVLDPKLGTVNARGASEVQDIHNWRKPNSRIGTRPYENTPYRSIATASNANVAQPETTYGELNGGYELVFENLDDGTTTYTGLIVDSASYYLPEGTGEEA